MSAKKVRADYAVLAQIAQMFDRESANTKRTLDQLHKNMDVLLNGSWVGENATKFYREMIADVLPAVKRLGSAFEQAANTTKRSSEIMKQAEADAARLFSLQGDGPSGSGGPGAPVGLGGEAGPLSGGVSYRQTLMDPGGGGGGRSGGNGDGSAQALGVKSPGLQETPEQGDGEPEGVPGTINSEVNTRTSPGRANNNSTGERLPAGTQVTVIGATYDKEDGYQWLLVETEDGERVWVAADYVALDASEIGDVPIYDLDGNPVPAAELPLRSAEAEILLRYGIDIKMYQDGETDKFRDPTVADTAAVQGALADLEELEEYGVTLAPKGRGSNDEWTPNEIDDVNEGVTEQADGLYAFAQSQGFDLRGVTPGELYRDIYFEGNKITVYRNSAQTSAEGFYGKVSDNAITLYDNAFEGPFNVKNVTGRNFTTQLLMQHEVQHQADFDHSSALSNNFSDLVDGSYQFQREYTITYRDAQGNLQTYRIARDPVTGELPTLDEVQQDIGVDLVNYGTAAYTGMDFVVASSPSAGELPIDITLAVITGQGFRIGENYSLEENLGAIVRREWGEQQMVDILKADGYKKRTNRQPIPE